MQTKKETLRHTLRTRKEPKETISWQKQSQTLFREKYVTFKGQQTKIMLVTSIIGDDKTDALTVGYVNNTCRNFCIANRLSVHILQPLFDSLSPDQYQKIAKKPRSIRKEIAQTINAFINQDWEKPPQLESYKSLYQNILIILKKHGILIPDPLPKTHLKEKNSWYEARHQLTPIRKTIHPNIGIYLFENKKNIGKKIILRLKKRNPITNRSHSMTFGNIKFNHSNHKKAQLISQYVLYPIISYLWIEHPNYCTAFFNQKELQQKIIGIINEALHQTSLNEEQLKKLHQVVFDLLDEHLSTKKIPVSTAIHDTTFTTSPKTVITEEVALPSPTSIASPLAPIAEPPTFDFYIPTKIPFPFTQEPPPKGSFLALSQEDNTPLSLDDEVDSSDSDLDSDDLYYDSDVRLSPLSPYSPRFFIPKNDKKQAREKEQSDTHATAVKRVRY